MSPLSDESASSPESNFDEPTVEEVDKWMSKMWRRRRARHRKWSSGRSDSNAPKVQFIVPSEDPIADLSRKFDALAAFVLARIPDVTGSISPVSQDEQPSLTENVAPLPTAVLAEYLTRAQLKLLRALWGQGDVSLTDLWWNVWERNDSVIRDTIASAVKRTNKRLGALPSEFAPSMLILWRQKKLRLVMA